MVPGAPGQIRKQVQIMKKKRNKLERKLDEYNHTMELIRTIIPVGYYVFRWLYW